MPLTPNDLQAGLAKQAPAATPPPVFRSFLDNDAQRTFTQDAVVDALSQRQFENATHQLRLSNVRLKPKTFTKKDEKEAVGKKGFVHQPVHGQWELVDKASGNVLDKKDGLVAYLPHMTDRGTYVVRGTNYVINHQTRLRPGVYTRKQRNGLIESQLNVAPKSGRGFRVRLDPQTGKFKMRIGQGESDLYPVLLAAGIDREQLREAWGDKLFKANESEDRNRANLKKTLQRWGVDVDSLEASEIDTVTAETLNNMQVDPEVMEMTSGVNTSNLSPALLLATTQKMLGISRGNSEGDDRDSIAFQTVHGPEDFMAERINKDAGSIGRKLLWNATKDGNLSRVKPGAYREAIYSLFNGTGLAQAVEDTNPIEIADLRLKLSRMGEGALRSTEAAPREARGVQPSHYGFIDGIRTPESDKIGLDMRVAHNTFKGKDNKLYTAVLNKAGKTEIVSATQMLKGNIGFAGEHDSDKSTVRAMVNGKLREVPRSKVDFWIKEPEETFAATSNLIPFISASKAQRALMGARMTTQALPLVEREAPLVQAAMPGEDSSFDQMLGVQAGAIRSDEGGTVTRVDRNSITIRKPNGETDKIELYDELPMNRLTNLNQTPLVKAGDRIEPGQVVANSNFTDGEGAVALGRNLRVGYLAHSGATFEDAVVISEAAAAKLAAETSLKFDREKSETLHSVAKNDYRSLFPATFSADQLKTLDDNGVIKKNTVVHPGDPLLLQVDKAKRQGVGAIMRSQKVKFKDESQVWEHNYPGQVVDVFGKGPAAKVVVRSILPAKEGDKLSGRFGDKGVISKIVPDDQMPQTPDGNPLEILVSPTGLNSRGNASQMVEAALGKIAEKRGKKFMARGFRGKGQESFVQWAMDELKEAGLSDTDDLIDPTDNRKIKDVSTGNRYYMRLHHLAEKKLSARDTDEYTSDDTPAKGGKHGAKRISLGETAALLSAGATEVLRDAKLVRGQRNDDYWRAIQLGYNPAMPTTSVASQKFLEQLRGAGVNVQGRGDNTYIMPATDESTSDLAKGRTVKSGDTFDWDTMEPIKGGLFDVGATGGTDGTQWSAFELPQPVLNPIMQEPVQKLLGLSEKNLRNVLAGRQEYFGSTGPGAIKKALVGLDNRIDKEIAAAKEQITTGAKSKRDTAVKRLAYLTSFKKMGVKPSQTLINKVPVLPPKYRPISRVDSMMLVADPNYLYADMIGSADNLAESESVFGKESTGDAYLDMYDSVKAVVGLGDPVSKKLRDKKVRGILAQAVGIGRSPKSAQFQRRIVGTAVDQVGRAVIAPDPKLDIDQIGVPEEMAWTQYRKYVVRKLVQRGMPATQAVKSVIDRSGPAERALHEVMEERPVWINRAPTLHRHSIIGGRPVLIKGDAIKLAPAVEGGLGADHDGDAVQLHVPSTDEAVDEVYNKLMPSKNLRSPANFDVHMFPENEFVAGIYEANRVNKEKRARVFQSNEAAVAAYMRGEISVNDPITIAKA